jgi:hypothetical protein
MSSKFLACVCATLLLALPGAVLAQGGAAGGAPAQNPTATPQGEGAAKAPGATKEMKEGKPETTKKAGTAHPKGKKKAKGKPAEHPPQAKGHEKGKGKAEGAAKKAEPGAPMTPGTTPGGAGAAPSGGAAAPK